MFLLKLRQVTDSPQEEPVPEPTEAPSEGTPAEVEATTIEDLDYFEVRSEEPPS